MAIDATKTTKIFQILGIPEGGAGYESLQLATIFGPAGEAYDFSTIVTALNTKITALAANAGRTTQAEALITRFDAIGSTSVIQIQKSSTGAEGTIVDHPLELRKIKKQMINLLGFFQEMSFYEGLAGDRTRVSR